MKKKLKIFQTKAKDLNILFKSTKNLGEILKVSIVICENCKDDYDPASILKHIGNNQECKAFYGSDFERLKKEKNRLRIKDYKLAKQREKYASDPNMREKKKESNKKSYQTLKDKQAAIKEKKSIEYVIPVHREYKYCFIV